MKRLFKMYKFTSLCFFILVVVLLFVQNKFPWLEKYLHQVCVYLLEAISCNRDPSICSLIMVTLCSRLNNKQNIPCYLISRMSQNIWWMFSTGDGVYFLNINAIFKTGTTFKTILTLNFQLVTTHFWHRILVIWIKTVVKRYNSCT